EAGRNIGIDTGEAFDGNKEFWKCLLGKTYRLIGIIVCAKGPLHFDAFRGLRQTSKAQKQSSCAVQSAMTWHKVISPYAQYIGYLLDWCLAGVNVWWRYDFGNDFLKLADIVLDLSPRLEKFCKE